MRNLPGLDSNEVEMNAQERAAERERTAQAHRTETAVRAATGRPSSVLERVRRWLKQDRRRDREGPSA